MTKEEKQMAIEMGNEQLLKDLKKHRVCFSPKWSDGFLFYVQKTIVRDRAIKIKILYGIWETSGGNKVIILKN